jgi:ferritin
MKHFKSFEQFIAESNGEIKPEVEATNEAIEHEPRLVPAVTEILNAQIANELNSSQIYRSMSAWLDDQGWIGGSKLFFKYAEEELAHMTKIYNYLYEKNCRAIVPACSAPVLDYPGVRELVEAGLQHEFEVTTNWTNIANLAKDNNDHDTYTLAMGFVNEQREEEEKLRNILFKMDLEMPNWKIDELFSDILG